MKNYIEVVHEYDESDNENWKGQSRDVWYAVAPTGWNYRQAKRDEEYENWTDPVWDGFNIQGGMPFQVRTKEDIAGLRKLLDEIEKEF